MGPLDRLVYNFVRHASCLRHPPASLAHRGYSAHGFIAGRSYVSLKMQDVLERSQIPTKVLQLANLNPTTSNEVLREIFNPFPGFKCIPQPGQSNISSIYVEFWSTASAARALETLKSSQPLVIDGQEIAVDFASFPHDQSTDEVSIEQPVPQDLHSTPSRSICVQFKGDRNQPRSILANEIKQLLGELPGLQSFRQRRAVISCIWVTYGSEENASAAIDMLRSHPKLGHLVSAGYAHETRIKKEPSKRLLIQCDHREDPKAIYRFVQGLDGYLSCQQVREASGFQASRFIAEFHSSKAAADAMDFMESYPSPHDSILAVSFIHPRESLPDHRSNVLFVDNVSLSATQSDLQRIFGSFKGFRGLMLRHRPQRRHLQRHEGWGYVEFSSAFAADAARSATDGKSLRGSIIQVSFSENHSQQDTIAIVKPNRKYGPSGKDSPKSNALFIKGIADVALEDVEDAFSDYSGYDQAIMLSDKAKGSTPHCKVLFKTVEDAAYALSRIREAGGLWIGSGEGRTLVEALRLGGSPRDQKPEIGGYHFAEQTDSPNDTSGSTSSVLS